MKKQNGFLLLVLICMATLLASCRHESGSTDSEEEQVSEQETPVAEAFIKGNIIQKTGNRWLITAYIEKNGAPYIDAIWFTVNEHTVFQNNDGHNVPPETISIGAQVEAWHTGIVAESYPAQTVAAKIIMHDDAQKVPEGMVGQTKAVQAALQSQTASNTAWAVKNASLDAENGYWNIELVKYETINKPVTIRIDARSGQTVPIPVAENAAFRLFSPLPGTEAGPAFTVEGEARVFEAAFSWTLVDGDGHTILAEGHEMAEEGAPAWGRFHFDVSYKKASQPDIMLILFIHSAKDGSVQYKLTVPLKVPGERIKPQQK